MLRLKTHKLSKEDKKYIQDQLLNKIAPAHDGLISLNGVQRLFSDLVSRTDIETILQELVKNNLVRSHDVQGDTIYVFTQIARDAGQSYLRKLDELDRNTKYLTTAIAAAEEELQAAVNASKLWQDGWENSQLDATSKASIQSYVTREWQARTTQLQDSLTSKKVALDAIQNEMKGLQQKVQTSFPESGQ